MRFQFRVDATFSSSVFGFVSVSYRNWSVHLFDSCFFSCLRSASSRQLWPSAEHRLTRASLRSCDKAEPRLGWHRIGSAELGSAATGTVEQRRRATGWAHASYATITPARRRPGETAIRREGAMPICLEKIMFSLSLFLYSVSLMFMLGFFSLSHPLCFSFNLKFSVLFLNFLSFYIYRVNSNNGHLS